MDALDLTLVSSVDLFSKDGLKCFLQFKYSYIRLQVYSNIMSGKYLLPYSFTVYDSKSLTIQKFSHHLLKIPVVRVEKGIISVLMMRKVYLV